MTPALAPVPLVIRSMRQENAECATLELDPSGLAQPPLGARPGQFNMLYMFGIGESAISVSGDCADPTRIVHTLRAVGPVTTALKALSPGAAVGLRGPFGRPWPLEEAEGADIVLVAGGIGLAPLRPVLHALRTRRDRYGRIVLLYGARSPDDVLFRHELDRLGAAGDIEIAISVDYAAADWIGRVGFVTALIPHARFDSTDTVAMICGPEIMMRFAASALQDRGLPAGRIFVSMERNMKCAIGQCGHCQFGPHFVCKDGPIFAYGEVETLLTVREV